MTISTSESWSLPLSTPSVAANVRVSSTRRKLDRQSPTLAFMISTPKPFVEIVIAVRQELFDPARAQQRSASSFFASRVFGLTRTQSGEATYFVPAAVLRSLLQGGAVRQLYFTAIGYDDEEGHGAVPAHTPAELARDAPAVLVEAGFGAQELSRAFGTSLERLLRHGPAADAPREAVSTAYAAPVDSRANQPTTSRWTGTGRIQIPRVRVESAAQEFDGFALSEPDLDGFDREVDLASGQEAARYETYGTDDEDRGYDHHDHDHDHDEVQGSPQPAASASYGGAWSGAAADDDYDDGFGEDADAPAVSSHQARTRGPEPAELIDEEDVAQSYGDESDDEELAAEQSAQADLRPGPLPPPAEQRALFEEVAKGLNGGSTLYEVARRTQDGVSFGIGAFTQGSGALGRLLELMRGRDAAEFARVFGPQSEALVTALTAPTREARLAPIGGAPLWEGPWLERFSRAGDRDHASFRGAQNELLSTTVFQPLWPVAWGLGLTSDRALAVVTALGIHQGAEAFGDWLVARVGPAQAGPQIQRALAAVGATDLAAFQARAGLPATSTLDARTHAALALALRGLGDRAPVTVLAPRQMLEAVQRHVGTGGVGRKVAELLATPSLSDRVR